MIPILEDRPPGDDYDQITRKLWVLTKGALSDDEMDEMPLAEIYLRAEMLEAQRSLDLQVMGMPRV